MPCLTGKTVAVAGRAGHGVALSAGCDDDSIGTDFLPVLGHNAADAGATFFVRFQQQTVGTGLRDAAAGILGLLYQCIHNVGGMVGNRKDTLATLHLERDSTFFEKSHHLIGVQGIEAAV